MGEGIDAMGRDLETRDASRRRDVRRDVRNAGQHDARDTGQHRAVLRARLGPAGLDARVRISTRGLLAVAALVAGTLLSTAAIVAVATRKLPPSAMPAGMKRSRW